MRRVHTLLRELPLAFAANKLSVFQCNKQSVRHFTVSLAWRQYQQQQQQQQQSYSADGEYAQHGDMHASNAANLNPNELHMSSSYNSNNSNGINSNSSSSITNENNANTNTISTVSASAPGSVMITYTPGAGPGHGLAVPHTALTEHCDVISESLSKVDELETQKKAQEALGAEAQILTSEGMNELMDELREAVEGEVSALMSDMRNTSMIHQAGMHELRRTLYYATSLNSREWLPAVTYTAMMRALTVEFLRRDNDGVLAPDDILYISTYMVSANFYNRHLWNRMEKSMQRLTNFESIDLPTIKGLTTKLYKTRRNCPRETLDVRRKILTAMVRRIGMLANDLDLPSLLGVLQCYVLHDMSPFALEPLAVRATNHVSEFTPQECANLVNVLRKFRLLRLEVIERIVERICAADQLNFHMATAALNGIRICFNQVSEGGRNALHAEPTKQKLRALGEQVGSRLDEPQYPALRVITNILDIIVNLKIYVPKKSLQVLFNGAAKMINVVLEHPDDLIDPETKKKVRPVTMEEGRQLQALLLHYGSDLAPELANKLRNALQEGLLPDEASLEGQQHQ